MAAENHPKTEWLKMILCLPLFNLDWAQLGAVPLLVLLVSLLLVSRLTVTLGGWAPSLHVVLGLLHVLPPCDLASRVAGPLMSQLRAPKSMRQ